MFKMKKTTETKVKKQLYFDKFAKQEYKMQIIDKATDKTIFGKELYLLLKAEIRAILRISIMQDISITMKPLYSILLIIGISIKIK